MFEILTFTLICLFYISLGLIIDKSIKTNKNNDASKHVLCIFLWPILVTGTLTYTIATMIYKVKNK